MTQLGQFVVTCKNQGSGTQSPSQQRRVSRSQSRALQDFISGRCGAATWEIVRSPIHVILVNVVSTQFVRTSILWCEVLTGGCVTVLRRELAMYECGGTKFDFDVRNTKKMQQSQEEER